MNPSLKFLTVGSLLLTACTQPLKPVELPAASATSPAPVVAEAPRVETKPQEVAPVLPNIELSDELLYQYLLTEIASQRGHQALAVAGSAELVRKTRDPRLARRAAQLALESGQMERAVEAFRLWREIEPTSEMAGRMLASLLLRGGRLDEAQQEFAAQLKAKEGGADQYFVHILQQAYSYPDKPAMLKMLRELARPYPRSAEGHWAVAQVAQLAGEGVLALVEVRQAHELRPDWEAPVALEAQLLMKTEPQQALEGLRVYLAAHPQARELRLQYARALLEQKQYEASRAEFQRLAQDSPDNADLAFAIALISIQMKDYAGAERQLQQALGTEGASRDRVQYYLGQLSEAKEDEPGALAHYREVKEGEFRFPAQLRAVYLIYKQEGLDAARAYLQQVGADNNLQRVQLSLIEAQMLREAKRFEDAYRVLRLGLDKLPNHPDLLYETAMLADRLGKHEESEQLLRKLIQLQPDHAQAYNALGYGMLERNERVVEALDLVQKALNLAPDDTAIMDSVGWGYFRNGRLDDGVNMLRRAYSGNPDPEIAAHLGEVLWVRGDREEASKLWLDSQKAHPDSEPLRAVIRKFLAR